MTLRRQLRLCGKPPAAKPAKAREARKPEASSRKPAKPRQSSTVQRTMERSSAPAGPPRRDPSCTDDDANCATWAAGGECERNAPFMLQRCASSCDACDRTARCRWDADDADMGVPAGARPALAERALAEFGHMEPTVLSHDPLVVQLDRFLSADEASAIIECAPRARAIARASRRARRLIGPPARAAPRAASRAAPHALAHARWLTG